LEILALANDDFHIFICFSSKDEAFARGVVEFLETHGLNCWISTRDVPPGQNYQEAIVRALEEARGIVFLFSENSNASGEIKKELSLAGGLNVPVFPLRMSPIAPSGALRYELATRQWIDAFPDRDEALRKLVATIRAVLDAPSNRGAEAPTATLPPSHALASVTNGASPKRHATPPREPVISPGSEEFEAVRALLARHIGPIAKVFVHKAATEASTRENFCEQLAAHVRAPADREIFLRAARARLAAKP
jgi:hypothetical protein